MSERKRSPHVKTRRSAAGTHYSNNLSGGVRDISHFVETYNHLLEKLYPAFALWNAVLYVARWQNYLLTLASIPILSLFFYFPSVLLTLLTLAAILIMAVGRYHGQTKARAELRKPPPVELQDKHQHLLKKQYIEQEQMHKSRLEFRQIVANIEMFMVNAEKALDYMYSIYLWRSPEVSLCVTLLLCLVLVLLCTFDLHSIGATIPAIVLFTNRHFFSRSIDLWKQLLGRLKDRLDRRKKERERTESNLSVENQEEVEREEVEEEEEEKGEEEMSGDNLHPPDEQDSSNEAGQSSDRNPTPELRHRTTSQVSTESAAAGGEMAGEGGGGEADSWVPIPPGGTGTPQTTKDGKSTQQGVCSMCNTSFFLKRKHDCNVCGQTFCRLCTMKVKKAALGVTSPTAYENSVRVCLNCKAKLDDIVHSWRQV